MTYQNDKGLARALLLARSAKCRCALATIVATRGSTPRKVGARMLVQPDGSLVGTVGGGCGEAEVIDAAIEVMHSGQPKRLSVRLTEDMFSWSPAVCGGVMDIFVELLNGTGRSAQALPPARHRATDAKGGL